MILNFQTQIWAISVDPDQTAPRLLWVYTVCHSISMLWMHDPMVKAHCYTFRIITANFWGVRKFRNFTVYSTLFPYKSIVWAALSTISLVCSISIRDWATSACMVPCAASGFPNATLSIVWKKKLTITLNVLKFRTSKETEHPRFIFSPHQWSKGK